MKEKKKNKKIVLLRSDQSILARHPIAYFCAEYAFDDTLPIYSGGLGVLAGDTIREASDQKLPMLGVGLFYHEGYFTQSMTKGGKQSESYKEIDPVAAGLRPVRTESGKTLYFHVHMKDRLVWFRAWEKTIGTIPVYLIDTNVKRNLPEDRLITQRLYGGDKEHRLKQEIILGIGGERMLFALDIHPSVYHLNEGHSAFAIFEITHHLMKEFRLDFDRAFARAHKTIVFTNHTIVPAGNDIFPKGMIKEYLGEYARELQLPMSEMLKKGQIKGKKNLFGMTSLSLSMSTKTNAVSEFHAKVASDIWPEHPMIPITNGVHMDTWVAENIKQVLGTHALGKVNQLNSKKLWNLHIENKRKMTAFINTQTNARLDPTVATVVWARRFASYKRPGLLFEEMDTLTRLAKATSGALQVVVAGKAHPRDTIGKDIIHKINKSISKANISSSVVYMPNYRIEIAKYLVAGADIWLNTPLRGQEASGTSGMKAGANGVLQFSTSDGWIDEVDWTGAGWIIDDEDVLESLYSLLEGEILPLYYTRSRSGVPEKWTSMMKKTMHIVRKRFSTTRMVSDYIDKMYSPCITSSLMAHNNAHE